MNVNDHERQNKELGEPLNKKLKQGGFNTLGSQTVKAYMTYYDII